MTLLSSLISPLNAGIYVRYLYSASAGQTTFSGSDVNGLTLSYKPGYVEVYVNGVIQTPTHYTATNGSSIVFTSGLSSTDVVYIIALSTLTISDTYLKSQSGADVANTTLFRLNIGAAGRLKTWTFLSSGSGTYTPPSGCVSFIVICQGGGGGGSGGANSSGGVAAAGNGGTTTFSGTGVSMSAGGGQGGAGSGGGYNGAATASGGAINIPGSYNSFSLGAGVGAVSYPFGLDGSNSLLGMGGRGAWAGASSQGGTGYGAGGGGGGGSTSGGYGGAGGGSGAYCKNLITSLASSYSYAVGAAGTYSAGVTNGNVGSAGIIIIEEYY